MMSMRLMSIPPPPDFLEWSFGRHIIAPEDLFDLRSSHRGPVNRSPRHHWELGVVNGVHTAVGMILKGIDNAPTPMFTISH